VRAIFVKDVSRVSGTILCFFGTVLIGLPVWESARLKIGKDFEIQLNAAVKQLEHTQVQLRNVGQQVVQASQQLSEAKQHYAQWANFLLKNVNPADSLGLKVIR